MFTPSSAFVNWDVRVFHIIMISNNVNSGFILMNTIISAMRQHVIILMFGISPWHDAANERHECFQLHSWRPTIFDYSTFFPARSIVVPSCGSCFVCSLSLLESLFSLDVF